MQPEPVTTRATTPDTAPVPEPVVLRVREDLGPFRADWDALVTATATASPFARSWWLDAVQADPAGGRACYLLLFGGSALIGGAALMRDRRRLVPRYRFLGQGTLTPDHLDLLAAPGREEAVVAELGAWFRRPGSRLLDLDGLVAGSLAHRAFGGTLTPGEGAPYVLLAGSAEHYLASLSSSFRRSLRRGQRRLAEDGMQHRRVPADEAASALEALWALHRERGDRERLLAVAAVLQRAVLAGVARQECRIDVLETAGDGSRATLAVSIAFQVGGRLSLYQLARSMRPEHAGVGTALLGAVILDAADAGLDEVDLLRGEEGYKAHFATGRRPLSRLRAAHGSPACVLDAFERVLRRAVHVTRAARTALSATRRPARGDEARRTRA